MRQGSYICVYQGWYKWLYGVQMLQTCEITWHCATLKGNSVDSSQKNCKVLQFDSSLFKMLHVTYNTIKRAGPSVLILKEKIRRAKTFSTKKQGNKYQKKQPENISMSREFRGMLRLHSAWRACSGKQVILIVLCCTFYTIILFLFDSCLHFIGDFSKKTVSMALAKENKTAKIFLAGLSFFDLAIICLWHQHQLQTQQIPVISD